MTAADEIVVIACDAPDELHCHYQGQYGRQGAFVALDLVRRRLYASYDAEIGGAVPMDVYHGQTRRYPIPVLTAAAANRLLGEIGPLAQRVMADWENEWDGSNHRARLGEDARKAEDEIGQLTDPGRFDMQDLVAEDAAEDWMQYGDDAELVAEHGITPATTDARLDEIAGKIAVEEATQGGYGYTVITGLGQYLRDLRDKLAGDSGGDGA